MRSRRQISDELLVLQWQSGDRKSFETLFKGWNKILYRHANRMTKNSSAAADVMQEAWISMLKSINSLSDPARFRAWAYQVVTRRAADWVRREQRNRQLDQLGAIDETQVTDLYHTGDEGDQLTLALKQLPDEYRFTVAMFYLDQLSVKEIAHALSIPEGTVKSRLFHSRQQLKQILERLNDERD